MKKIIDEVLAAEKEADEIVLKAKKEAAAIKNSAEAEVNELLNDAKTEARGILSTGLNEARSLAAAEYDKTVIEEKAAARRMLDERRNELDAIIDRVASLVTGMELS